MSAYGAARAPLQAAVSAAFDEIRRVDALMSIHRADSEVSRLNARAATEAVAVSPDLFTVIAKAQEIAAETEGSFDITIGPLADLWGFIWKEYRLPSDAELRERLPLVNHHWIELDSSRRTVRFLTNGVSIDLGGIAKGFAVDCAIERLRALGITRALVKAGGDLRVIGAPPGKTHWTVQLEDPQKKGRRSSLPLRDAALSTSGNYENYFEIGGRRYSHILDPRTGLPVEGIAACTLIADTCLESDAWATACFVYGADRSLARFGGQFAIRFTLTPSRRGASGWPIRQSSQFPLRE